MQKTTKSQLTNPRLDGQLAFMCGGNKVAALLSAKGQWKYM
ncbi:hypothetical protein [Undibacterium seohonense]|nr:hypothetical protein [Undibacterium seohonense]